MPLMRKYLASKTVQGRQEGGEWGRGHGMKSEGCLRAATVIQGHGKDCGFFSEWDGKPSRGYERRSDMMRLR